MTAREEALTFACGDDTLVGIVSRPPATVPTRDIGVVIVVGGPQVRVGSHRLFVLLARAMASAGFAVLRFDYRGMGDSTGQQRNFEHVSEDIGAAITALQTAVPAARRIVLWGLCDGASAALLYLHERLDPRVAGVALLNPWVRSEASLARTHVKHYYVQRLREGAFWRKLFGGQVALGAVRELANNLRRVMGNRANQAEDPSGKRGTPYQQRMALAWGAFEGQTLLLLSENDYTAREFVEFTAASADWRAALQAHPPVRRSLEGADHTCSASPATRALLAATRDWLTAMR